MVNSKIIKSPRVRLRRGARRRVGRELFIGFEFRNENIMDTFDKYIVPIILPILIFLLLFLPFTEVVFNRIEILESYHSNVCSECGQEKILLN